MTPGQFLAAAIIAFYAMVGGALMNAAITAPSNTKRLLNHKIWRKRYHFGSSALALLVVAGYRAPREDWLSHVSYDPLSWIVAAHIAMLLLMEVAAHTAEHLAQEAAHETQPTPPPIEK